MLQANIGICHNYYAKITDDIVQGIVKWVNKTRTKGTVCPMQLYLILNKLTTQYPPILLKKNTDPFRVMVNQEEAYFTDSNIFTNKKTNCQK